MIITLSMIISVWGGGKRPPDPDLARVQEVVGGGSLASILTRHRSANSGEADVCTRNVRRETARNDRTRAARRANSCVSSVSSVFVGRFVTFVESFRSFR